MSPLYFCERINFLKSKLFLDGAYENQMRFFPPPLTMVIFSIIEVAFFVTDIIKTEYDCLFFSYEIIS